MNHDADFRRNEAETRADLIDPALKAAGWGVVEGSLIRREYIISQGRLLGVDQRAKQEIADYVLFYHRRPLAVVEAKAERAYVTAGLAQAKQYAQKLAIRFTYATNGHELYQVDMESGQEGVVTHYPTPQDLWAMTFANVPTQETIWRDRFDAVPFEDRGGQWQPRYYQQSAITKTLDALAQGQDRILLTLATGTGKTAIAFQIAWKLFHSRWNLTDWRRGLDGTADQAPSRRPRILFLADRNILADQAFNAFSAFDEDALVRIAPDVIRKQGRVPKNGSIFFTIFQTFMSGQDPDGNPQPNFGDYPADFFDLIIIDECHRGGANDEGNWRAILDYFSPAVQLGLTATPKQTTNADTYAYFGEPIYLYSLKEGINDGYLTPFKVKQIQTTLDEYQYVPDDEVMEGQIDPSKRYEEGDFNREIVIPAREQERVRLFMAAIDQQQKTLVFCATQDHALMVRDLINQQKSNTDPSYCVRVTADDGARGEQHLRTFQDNEKTIPTILTTSRKLSTGVDARNVRNIVLMRPIRSMIEFKQIIGRGTRLFDGKDYFTIYDFVRAYELFNDAQWDGEPVEPTLSDRTLRDDPQDYNPVEEEKPESAQMVRIKLADGKARTIQHMMTTSFWGPDGKPVSADQFVQHLYGELLPEFFKDEAQLCVLWSQPETRRKLLDGLGERGCGEQELADLRRMVDAEHADLYDVLAYVAFAREPMSREERVNNSKPRIFTYYEDEQQRAFLNFVLEHYIKEGVSELDLNKLSDLLKLKYESVPDALNRLGGEVAQISRLFVGFQRHLYEEEQAAA